MILISRIVHKLALITIVLVLTSCASPYSVDSKSRPISSRTWAWSIGTGVVSGYAAGIMAKKQSPNKASETANFAVFGAITFLITALTTGYILHKNELEEFKNQELENNEYLYQNFSTPIELEQFKGDE